MSEEESSVKVFAWRTLSTKDEDLRPDIEVLAMS